MINDDKTFYHKALVWSAFLFLVIKPLVTVYHRYAIFLRPISSPIHFLQAQGHCKLRGGDIRLHQVGPRNDSPLRAG